MYRADYQSLRTIWRGFPKIMRAREDFAARINDWELWSRILLCYRPAGYCWLAVMAGKLVLRSIGCSTDLQTPIRRVMLIIHTVARRSNAGLAAAGVIGR